MSRWFYVPINPEPWETGGLAIRRKNRKMFPVMTPSGRLESYKAAVFEELVDYDPLPWKEFQLTFYFWRKLEVSWTVEKGRKTVPHQVDATNMQKALEDALQGVIIGNDRDVRRIESVIVEQGTNVRTPRTFIRADEWLGFDLSVLPQEIFDQVEEHEAIREQSGWKPPEDDF